MHLPRRPRWALAEKYVTDEALYRSYPRPRREFLKTLGLGAAGLMLGRAASAATAGFPSKENPAYPASALKPITLAVFDQPGSGTPSCATTAPL